MLLSAQRNHRAIPEFCWVGRDSCLLIILPREGKTHPVDSVIFPEEDISQNPQGLSIGGGQVSDFNPEGAVAIVLQTKDMKI